ncbi:unnamed protein product, partial [marine sediment metagenome]
TGWTDRTDKDDLIDSLCDSVLKYAIMEHPFRDLTTLTSGETEITTEATSVDLSGFSPAVFKIISARLLRVTNTTDSGRFLPLKNRKYWDKYVIDPTTNVGGVPTEALRVGTTLYLNRPIEDDWKLRLRYTSLNTYTDDNTETPSELLDLFVEYKVTADLFFDLEDMDKFALWNRRAIGNNPEFPGGELGRAIRTDDKEEAKENVVTRPWELRTGLYGYGGFLSGLTTSYTNWTGADPFNQIRSWF